MIGKEEIKYIVDKIEKTESIIEKEFFDLFHEQGSAAEFPESYIKLWILEKLSEVYNLHICYFEVKGFHVYLQNFKRRFDKVVEDDDLLYESQFEHPDDTTPSLKFINDLKSFKSPFHDFHTEYILTPELKKLLQLLNSTSYILMNAGVKAVNESEICNTLFWVIGLYFRTTRKGGRSAFISKFTVYKPDLFIPELKVAIEFKLVRVGHNIEKFIDQIRVDATNYVDDHNYNVFLAVLIIKDPGAATHEHVQQSWEEKKFPKNWKLIIVGAHT